MRLLRKSPLALAVLAVTLAACQPKTADAPQAPVAAAHAAAPASDAATDARFAGLSKQWLDGWLKLNPVSATQIGEHRYDSEVDDLSEAGRKAQVDFAKKLLTELDTVDLSKLSRENQIDAAILRNQLRSDVWGIDTLQSWAWDPQVYSGLAGGAI